MSQVLLQLEKLEEVEATTKPIIQEMQQEIDESAKNLATQNAEYLKKKQELAEKYQKENAELEVVFVIFESKLKPNNLFVNVKVKNWEINAKFVKEMATLKERLKEKVNWSQVDLLMVCHFLVWDQ
jgi:SMC interacting uncharacterized protein involved in chromosome segregation